MMRALAILLFVMSRATLVLAQEEAIPSEPELRVIVEPIHVLERGAYVQGQIRLRILLLSPRKFETLRFQPPQLDGATIVTLSPPRTYALTYAEQKGFGYETRLAIFPERSGTLTIPDIDILGETLSAGGETHAFSTHGDATTIRVRPISPLLNSDWWVVADDITLEEQWTPAPDTLEVGATVERRVVMTVTGARLEQLPPLEQAESDAYAIVGEDFQETMEVTKDGVISRVEHVWNLRVLSSGVFNISPIVVDYWNPVSDRPTRAVLPGERIEPLPPDIETARQVLIDEAASTHRGRRIGAILLLSIPAILAGGLLVAFVYCAWPTRADRTLIRRSRAAQGALDGFAAVIQWSRESYPRTEGPALTESWARIDAQGSKALTRLQSALFSLTAPTVNVEQVAQDLVKAARRARLRAFVEQTIALVSRPFRARNLYPQAHSTSQTST